MDKCRLSDLCCVLCNKTFEDVSLLISHVIKHESNDTEPLLDTDDLEEHKNESTSMGLIKNGSEKISNQTKVRRNATRVRENIATLLNSSTAVPFKYFMNRFRCFYCDLDDTNFEPIKMHTNLMHSHCDPSEKSMKAVRGKDNIIKLDVMNLSCKICGVTLTDLSVLVEHITKFHKKKCDQSIVNLMQPFEMVKTNMPCPLCSVVFRYFGKLLNHLNKFHSNNNIVCVHCGQTFRNQPNYRSHISRYHRAETCKCPDCVLEFPNGYKLAIHRANAHGVKSIKCSKCNEKFISQYQRQRHLLDVHGTGHKCCYCGKMFTRNSFMVDHVRRSHLKERNVECRVCKERFFNATFLKIHMVKHDGQRNYHCDVCGKTFLWKKNLIGHMMSHSRNA